MSKRFALTAAGVATAAIGSTAAAELITFTVHNDAFIQEASWQVIDEGGTIIASMFVSGFVYLYSSQSTSNSFTFGAWNSSAGTSLSGYFTGFQMDLGAGTYTVDMQDTYADGWVWQNVDGSDAFNVAGKHHCWCVRHLRLYWWRCCRRYLHRGPSTRCACTARPRWLELASQAKLIMHPAPQRFTP